MSDLSEILAWLQRIDRNHEDLKAGVQNMLRFGRVVARDKDKGVRLQTDADGSGGDEPHKTPWGQPAEPSGYARRVPRDGEQCAFLGAFGDLEQGLVLPLTHSDDKPSPASDVDEIVIANHGKIKLSIDKAGTSLIFANDKVKTVWEGSKITHTVDGNTTVFEKDKITFPDGSKVRHGDRNIGRDHIHGGVFKGGDKTGDPEA